MDRKFMAIVRLLDIPIVSNFVLANNTINSLERLPNQIDFVIHDYSQCMVDWPHEEMAGIIESLIIRQTCDVYDNGIKDKKWIIRNNKTILSIMLFTPIEDIFELVSN